LTTEIIDVIDTAVKIGLGALISGISAWAITKTSHSNEKKRELLKRRLDIMETSITQADLYFNSHRDLWSAIDGVRTQHSNNTKLNLKIKGELESYKFIRDADSELIKTRSNEQSTESKLRLIGLDKAAEILLSTTPLENEIRQLVLFDKNLPSKKQLDSWDETLTDIIKRFHSEMAKGFAS